MATKKNTEPLRNDESEEKSFQQQYECPQPIKTPRPKPPRPEKKSYGSSYYQKLQHPNWQRKRLEVMELADFRCTECESSDEMLNVHHTYYTKGAEPWEYPTESLVCLCKTCHEKREAILLRLKQTVGLLDSDMQKRVLGFASALLTHFTDKPTLIDGEMEARGVCDSLAAIHCDRADAFDLENLCLYTFQDGKNILTEEAIRLMIDEWDSIGEAIGSSQEASTNG